MHSIQQCIHYLCLHRQIIDIVSRTYCADAMLPIPAAVPAAALLTSVLFGEQVKRTCYAQSSQIRQIRKKMVEIMQREAASCDLKELVGKFIPESIGTKGYGCAA